jgi:hypothetical protein
MICKEIFLRFFKIFSAGNPAGRRGFRALFFYKGAILPEFRGFFPLKNT